MEFLFGLPYALLGILFMPLLKIKSSKSKSENSVQAGIPFLIPPDASDLLTLKQPFYLKHRQLIINSLRMFCFAFFILALARPQLGSYESIDQGEGRDLLMSLDVSGSMKALDFVIDGERSNRLAALKRVSADFIQARKGDRLGLMVFGEDVYTKTPLTPDTRSLLSHLKDLEVGMAGDSTSLGDALLLAVKRLRNIETKSKAIILVTDGTRTSGQLDPKEAAHIAAQLGIKVYTIGIGGSGRVPFPTEDLFGRPTIIYREIPLDEKTLTLIAETTGGRYFHASNTEELERVYEDIDSLETREDPEITLVTKKEYFPELLALGLLFLIVGEFLERGKLRVVS